MLFSFHCPTCRGILEADASSSGSQAVCPQCGSPVAIPHSRVEAGVVLAGFRLERLLGKGGMGEVFLARQLSVDREVAVKILPPGFAQDAIAVQRFLHEGRLAARLDHATIATVYEAGEDSGTYYLAMAYIEGESLHQRLRRDRFLSEGEALRIGRAVADALAYAYDAFQLLHRDIKPANIMIDTRGRVFLMDLGLAKSVGENNDFTLSGTILGTPQYMSPEQAAGQVDLQPASDIYALGATLYHLLTGSPPFGGDTVLSILQQQIHAPLPPPQERNPALSPGCAALLETMLAKRPEERYATWGILLADMDRILTGSSSSHSAQGPQVGTLPSESAARQKALARQAQKALARRHEAGHARPPERRTAKTGSGQRKSRLPLAAAALVTLVLVLALIGGLAAHGRRSGSASLQPPPTMPIKAPTTPLETAPPAAEPAAEPAAIPVETPPEPAATPAAAENAPSPTQPEAVEPHAETPPAATQRNMPPRISLPDCGSWELQFDGTQSHLLIPTLTFDGSHPITLEVVLTAAAGNGQLQDIVGNGNSIALARNDTHCMLRVKGTDSSYPPLLESTLQSGRPVHLAGVWDGRQQRLYVNGNLQGTVGKPKHAASSVPFMVGGAPDAQGSFAGNAFKGAIACVRISRSARYNTDFSPEKVLPFTADADTLCLLDLEEAEGDVAMDGSGNNHHARIRGATWVPTWPCPLSEDELQHLQATLQQANPGSPELLLRVAGLPAGNLSISLAGCSALKDISPLAGLPIAELELSNTSVADLSPLRGMAIGRLNVNRWNTATLQGDGIRDLSPLAGMPLDSLGLANQTQIRDLSPLAGAPLRCLILYRVPAASLAPLTQARLQYLDLGRSLDAANPATIRDIASLRGMPLRVLLLVNCPELVDIDPIAGCATMELLMTPSHLPPPGPQLTRDMPQLKYLNPAPNEPGANELRWALTAEIATSWRQSLAQDGLGTPPEARADLTPLANPILAGRSGEAMQYWNENQNELKERLTPQERDMLDRQLRAVAGMERHILASFRNDAGKRVTIELENEAVTCDIQAVTTNGIRVLQLIRQANGEGRIQRLIRPQELSIGEKLRRLDSEQPETLNIQRGILALEAKRPDVARRLFEQSQSPLGQHLAEQLDARLTLGREDAAEKALDDLLRQISASTRLESRKHLVNAVRERSRGDFRRVETARRLLADFSQKWGRSKAAEQWIPALHEALEYPLAVGTWTIPELGMEFIPILPGSFRMGAENARGDEQPLHQVRISQGYWLTTYEVARSEYDALMSDKPGSVKKAGRHPAGRISWTNAVAFCNELTARETAAKRLPHGYVYRLPTEAEWEFAARGGVHSQGSIYAGSNTIDEVAWYRLNSQGKIYPGGRKKANELGLYDMSGNVWEWCHDWYGPYSANPQIDPQGPAAGLTRVLRGGSFCKDPVECRVTIRYNFDMSTAYGDLGFRVALAPILP